MLAEANALSARIIKIVNGWYGEGVGGGGGDNIGRGGDSNNGDKVKGLILRDDKGALCLGGGVDGSGLGCR